jgi:hypothetical protein
MHRSRMLSASIDREPMSIRSLSRCDFIGVTYRGYHAQHVYRNR